MVFWVLHCNRKKPGEAGPGCETPADGVPGPARRADAGGSGCGGTRGMG